MSKAEHVTGRTSYGIPEISHDDLFAFHEAHFSQHSMTAFGGTFLSPNQEEQTQDEEWEDDDGLGYYEDGVKRTLTDEQIEIFRHSELEALRKEQEKKPSKNPLASPEETLSSAEAASAPSPQSVASSLRNAKQKRRKKGGKREPKPDLRKRTWDVVDKGLDSLDYD